MANDIIATSMNLRIAFYNDNIHCNTGYVEPKFSDYSYA